VTNSTSNYLEVKENEQDLVVIFFQLLLFNAIGFLNEAYPFKTSSILLIYSHTHSTVFVHKVCGMMLW